MATMKMDSSGYTVDSITANSGTTSVATRVGVWTVVTWNSQYGSRRISFEGSVIWSETTTSNAASFYRTNFFESNEGKTYTFRVLRFS